MYTRDMSMESAPTMGLMESKKYNCSLPLKPRISRVTASEVSGPVATIVIAVFSSMAVTSSRTTRMSGSRSRAAVTAWENLSRSTASACPAGTAVWRAMSISSEPARRISSFSNQGAVFSVSDFSELEQTNSAKFALWWAGVERMGRISNSSTATPRRAHCQAASEPASPAPMMRMGLGIQVRLMVMEHAPGAETPHPQGWAIAGAGRTVSPAMIYVSHAHSCANGERPGGRGGLLALRRELDVNLRFRFDWLPIHVIGLVAPLFHGIHGRLGQHGRAA